MPARQLRRVLLECDFIDEEPVAPGVDSYRPNGIAALDALSEAFFEVARSSMPCDFAPAPWSSDWRCIRRAQAGVREYSTSLHTPDGAQGFLVDPTLAALRALAAAGVPWRGVVTSHVIYRECLSKLTPLETSKYHPRILTFHFAVPPEDIHEGRAVVCRFARALLARFPMPCTFAENARSVDHYASWSISPVMRAGGAALEVLAAYELSEAFSSFFGSSLKFFEVGVSARLVAAQIMYLLWCLNGRVVLPSWLAGTQVNLVADGAERAASLQALLGTLGVRSRSSVCRRGGIRALRAGWRGSTNGAPLTLFATDARSAWMRNADLESIDCPNVDAESIRAALDASDELLHRHAQRDEQAQRKPLELSC